MAPRGWQHRKHSQVADDLGVGSVRTQSLLCDVVCLDTDWITVLMQPTWSLEPTIPGSDQQAYQPGKTGTLTLFASPQVGPLLIPRVVAGLRFRQ